MRTSQSLLTLGLAAAPLFGISNAWLIQLWSTQSTCVNTPGVNADTTRGGLADQNNTCMMIGIQDINAIEISDWDDGCNITFYRASTYGECFDDTYGPSAILWGPYSKEQWIETDATMKQYNKTCLYNKDIGAAESVSYICPSNDTSSSTSTSASVTSISSTLSSNSSSPDTGAGSAQATGHHKVPGSRKGTGSHKTTISHKATGHHKVTGSRKVTGSHKTTISHKASSTHKAASSHKVFSTHEAASSHEATSSHKVKGLHEATSSAKATSTASINNSDDKGKHSEGFKDNQRRGLRQQLFQQ